MTLQFNPYWEEYTELGFGDDVATALGLGPIIQELSIHATRELRDDLVCKYAWSITNPRTVKFVAEHLGPKAVEMGAGTGYWAYLLNQHGVAMTAYDATLRSKVFFPVISGHPNRLIEHADASLFLCWPPWQNRMAEESLIHYKGNKLVYIGQGLCGVTGTIPFHQLLATRWRLLECLPNTNWPGVADMVYVYERRG